LLGGKLGFGGKLLREPRQDGREGLLGPQVGMKCDDLVPLGKGCAGIVGGPILRGRDGSSNLVEGRAFGFWMGRRKAESARIFPPARVREYLAKPGDPPGVGDPGEMIHREVASLLELLLGHLLDVLIAQAHRSRHAGFVG